MSEFQKRRHYSLNSRYSGKDSLEKEMIKPNISRSQSSHEIQIYNKKNYDFGIAYTSLCKKYYPLIIKPCSKYLKNYCKKHFESFFYYCLTCNIHFCIKCQMEHKEHSIINLKEKEINDDEVIKIEKSIEMSLQLMFKQITKKKNKGANNKQKNEILNKIMNELERFNYFIIDSYKSDKYNFTNFFNFYYLFKIKDELKYKKNDILLLFFIFKDLNIYVII